MSLDLSLFKQGACSLHVFGHTDAAKRMADSVNVHWHALGWDSIGKWVAIRLSDGGSDGNLYLTKQEAVRFQLHEQQCAYVKLVRDQMSVCEAQIYLAFNRQAYDNGFRMADPDSKTGGRDLILSNRVETRISALRALSRKVSKF
jgi:hypothetical protein